MCPTVVSVLHKDSTADKLMQKREFLKMKMEIVKTMEYELQSRVCTGGIRKESVVLLHPFLKNVAENVPGTN